MKNISNASLSGYSYALMFIIFLGSDVFGGYITSIPIRIVVNIITVASIPVFDILAIYFAVKSIKLKENAGGVLLLIVGLVISIITISFLGVVSSCGHNGSC